MLLLITPESAGLVPGGRCAAAAAVACERCRRHVPVRQCRSRAHLRRLLSAGSRAFQEVYGVSRRPRSMACICPGACVAAVLHLPPLKAPCTVDIGELYVGMMRCHPSLLGVSGLPRIGTHAPVSPTACQASVVRGVWLQLGV